MVYTPFEAAERHRYIDKSIEATLTELHTPKIQQQLGARALLFEKLLSSAVVANVSHGVISLPEDYDYDACPLPVTTYNANDDLELSSDFNDQTPVQAKATTQVFKKWRPKDGTAQDFYEFYYDRNYSETNTPVSFGALTASQVGVTAALIPAPDQLQWFSNAPNKGIAIVKRRPIMMIEQRSSKVRASTSTIAHELTHVDQVNREPVVLVHSQRSSDMHSLREELEAYHYGFPFSAKELVEVGTDNIEETSTLVQISVEWTRMHNELDPSDPFRPSGFILRKLQDKHVGSILHGAIDYEGLVELVGSDSIETV